MGMMINRRRAYGGKKLPYDAEIEYLESSGKQYIDTLMPTSSIYKFEVEIAPVENGLVDFTKYALGCDNTGNNRFGMGYYKHNVEVRLGYYYYPTSGFNFKNFNVFTINRSTGKYEINGVSYNGMQNITPSNETFTLFARKYYNDGVPAIDTRKVSCKIKNFKAYDVNGGIIINYIPVRIGTTGYMYDKVSGQLFGNSGTGDFILGPDKQ